MNDMVVFLGMIKTLEPVIINDKYNRGGFFRSLPYIPSSTISGALISNYFRENKIDGWGFLIVGVILSVALAFLNILIVLADAIEAYYPLLWGQKPNESWNILTDEWMFNPMMILGVLILPLIKECLNWYRKSKSTQS